MSFEAHIPGHQRVRLFDGLVPTQLANQLEALTSGPIWRFGWGANSGDPFRYWHADFAPTSGGSGDCQEDLSTSPELRPLADLWSIAERAGMAGKRLLRAYANGHTYGCEGYIHTDSKCPTHWTAVYFSHAVWKREWAGETVFFEDDSDAVIACVQPVPGRITIFRGDIPHVARSPSRLCPTLRTCIVFKASNADLRS